MEPIVSVVMSVYNSELHLESAIQSILNQTFKNFELIIVNDGSTDSSNEIILNFMLKDARVKLIRQENCGLANSLNKAIDVAQGLYIARMDSDDISMPNRIEEQLKFIQEYDFDFVFSGITLIDFNSNKICDYYQPKTINKILNNLEINNYIPHPTVFFKKDVVCKLGKYNPKFKTGQDLEFWLRLRDKIRFGFQHDKLLEYRLNPHSVRKGIYNNYWFTVCNYCIWNNAYRDAFRYFKYLNVKQRIVIMIKMLFPYSFYIRKLK